MKFKLIIQFVFIGFVLFSCKKNKKGNTLPANKNANFDSVYISKPVNPQAKNVTLFSVAGVRCVNCPSEAKLVNELLDSTPKGRLNSLVFYPYFQVPNTHPWEGFDTLNSIQADSFYYQIGIPVGIPMGMVDQSNYNKQRFFHYSQYSSAVAAQLNKTNTFNLYLNTSRNSPMGSFSITVKCIYTGTNLNKNYLVYTALYETDLVGKQKGGGIEFISTGFKTDYKFGNVFRRMMSPVLGEPITEVNSKYATYVKKYSTKISPKWNTDNLYCIAWIVDAETKEIIHSVVQKALQ